MAKVVELPQLVWDGTATLDVAFPDSWEIELCHMAGHDRPALEPSLVRQAILHPIGSPPISSAARGSREVCIIFDDMSRPTRVANIVPIVLDELAKAGIEDHQIRFVCALGSHGTLTRRDFVKKLGEEAVSRFPVFNHNLVGACSLVGTTSFGTDLYINSEVVRCDYKIAIGCIVPHAFAGFGGGAKIILPGVASFETIRAMHRMKGLLRSDASPPGRDGHVLEKDAGSVNSSAIGATEDVLSRRPVRPGGRGFAFQQPPQPAAAAAGGDGARETMDFGGMACIEGNRIRENIEEAAAMVGLDFKIDAIVNTWGETVSLYAGAPRLAFDAALEEARRHYRTTRATDCDVVVTNTFAKANEGEGGVITGFASLKSTGGDLVLISNAPEGHVAHYLFGNWGSLGSDGLRLVVQLPPQVERLIVFDEYKDLTSAGYFAPREKVLIISDWGEVLRVLRERRGEGSKVAVYSSAEIQYCSDSLAGSP